MKCPKCSYVSHDYLDACRKCGRDLITFKQEIGLQGIRPGDLDLSLVLSGGAAAAGSRDDFNIDADFFGRQLFGQGGAVEADETEFDISLDDDFPMRQETAPPPRPHTDVADAEDTTLQHDDTLVEQPRPPAAADRLTAPDLTVDLIDMSDLEDAEETALDLGQASDLPRGGGAEARNAPDFSTTEPFAIGETLEATRLEPGGKAPGAGSPEVPADTERAADDLLDTELELEFEDLSEELGAAEAGPETISDLDTHDPRDDDEQNNPRPPERK
jgi:hypothetical protein